MSQPDKLPEVPDDLSPIYDSLDERDSARKRAVDIARQKADEATIESDREFFLRLAADMSDARFELHELFPEVFDD